MSLGGVEGPEGQTSGPSGDGELLPVCFHEALDEFVDIPGLG